MKTYGPKPLVEEHFHIQELIAAQDKRVQDREYHRNVTKEKSERDELIADAKQVVLTDFWCKDCKLDFKGGAVKQVETDWTNSSQRIAFYKMKCDCGKWCIRLITDRHKDAFWSKSRLMALDRGNHANDTIQPHETGFNLLYGKK